MSRAAEVPLQYKRNNDLRREIVIAAGIEDVERYDGVSTGLTRDHLLEIADALGVETERPLDELTLAELYPAVCDHVGCEYNANAGNQWKMGRSCLKAIHRAFIKGEDLGAAGGDGR